MAAGGASLALPWAPTLGLRLDLALDGLGILYALLATGIGAAVFTLGARTCRGTSSMPGVRRRSRAGGRFPARVFPVVE
jgi:hypothetical protein